LGWGPGFRAEPRSRGGWRCFAGGLEGSAVGAGCTGALLLASDASSPIGVGGFGLHNPSLSVVRARTGASRAIQLVRPPPEGLDHHTSSTSFVCDEFLDFLQQHAVVFDTPLNLQRGCAVADSKSRPRLESQLAPSGRVNTSLSLSWSARQVAQKRVIFLRRVGRSGLAPGPSLHSGEGESDFVVWLCPRTTEPTPSLVQVSKEKQVPLVSCSLRVPTPPFAPPRRSGSVGWPKGLRWARWAGGEIGFARG